MTKGTRTYFVRSDRTATGHKGKKGGPSFQTHVVKVVCPK